MLREYILAAINRSEIEAACRIAAKYDFVVFGTLYGNLLKQVLVSEPGEAMPVYFYEPG
ncbi:hypothetical protein [Desulfoscipio geothermicus]|uniref:Uncharacterized protein n=1 Tax=Desulfoscipio geothermicus DSM 3669 TaxID=1121426 RepID=A0A1I6DR72_9FIRM|nr:hypothetical protein [Desulfoscipio geothermicus]SFR07935.1 hypothetical protein SAMN05660706_11583 [Desulfoscipio geothermicus DSM 3669]